MIITGLSHASVAASSAASPASSSAAHTHTQSQHKSISVMYSLCTVYTSVPLIIRVVGFKPHLLVLHLDESLCFGIWSRQRQNGNRAVHAVVLCKFTTTQTHTHSNKTPLYTVPARNFGTHPKKRAKLYQINTIYKRSNFPLNQLEKLFIFCSSKNIIKKHYFTYVL